MERGCRRFGQMQWLMGSKCEGCSRVHHTVPGKQNWLSATSQCSQCYTASVLHRVLRAVGAKCYPQLWKAAPQHISPHMHDAVTHGMPEAWCLGAPVLSGSAPSPSFLLSAATCPPSVALRASWTCALGACCGPPTWHPPSTTQTPPPTSRGRLCGEQCPRSTASGARWVLGRQGGRGLQHTALATVC